MLRNFLIGIGGTGARVIESMIHLCAAGYGPDELSLFIVDPDAGNGNLTRTKTLISLYKQCRNDFKTTATTKKKLFKTNIKTPNELVWNIFEEKGIRLSDYISLDTIDADLKKFASVLFSEKELIEKLDQGFRGHPNIGAVVMANPDQNKEPWSILWDDITSDMRVFLVGSVFGGTGAAGLPTFGSNKMIKHNEKANIGNGESRVLLGGALVLPYFSMEKNNETNKRLFVTQSDFPIATKAALHYYNEKELGFDQLYLIGDSLNQKVGEFHAGSEKQENKPHYIELVTSLAAFDFFEQSSIEGIPKKLYYISGRDDEMVNWDSFPVSYDEQLILERQVELKFRLSTMTTFAYALCTYGLETLNKDHKTASENPWYRDHFKFKEKKEKDRHKNPRWGDNRTHINNFTKYLNQFFLAWICLIDEEKVSLVSMERIYEGTIQIGKKNKLVDRVMNKDNIGYFLKEKTKDGKDFNFFINKCLNGIDISGEKTISAANKFINIFYEAAMEYCKQNYHIE